MQWRIILIAMSRLVLTVMDFKGFSLVNNKNTLS